MKLKKECHKQNSVKIPLRHLELTLDYALFHYENY